MKARRLWRAALFIVLGGAGLWLCGKLLLPLVLPFLLGLAAAAAAQRPAAFLQTRCRLPRALASFVCVLLLYALLFGALYALGRLALSELGTLGRELPVLAGNLSVPLQALQKRLYALADRFPDGLGSGLHAGLKSFFESGSGLAGKLYERLFQAASGLISALPELVLFTVTALLSGFMLCRDYPQAKAWLARQLQTEHRARAYAVLQRLRAALGGWLRAQLRLMSVIFLLVTAGLLLLGRPHAPLFGLLIALVDALPVFGTGTVLIPWALVMFLRHETRCGIGLLVLYGAAALTRQALEPRLIGRQAGLNPVVTLAALYTGFRIFGVPGLILMPIGVLFLKQLWDHSGLQPG